MANILILPGEVVLSPTAALRGEVQRQGAAIDALAGAVVELRADLGEVLSTRRGRRVGRASWHDLGVALRFKGARAGMNFVRRLRAMPGAEERRWRIDAEIVEVWQRCDRGEITAEEAERQAGPLRIERDAGRVQHHRRRVGARS